MAGLTTDYSGKSVQLHDYLLTDIDKTSDCGLNFIAKLDISSGSFVWMKTIMSASPDDTDEKWCD